MESFREYQSSEEEKFSSEQEIDSLTAELENNFDQDTVEEHNKNKERLDYLINYRNNEVEKNKV